VPAGHLPLAFQFCLSPKNLQEATYSLGRCSSSYISLRLASVFEKKKAQVDEQLDMGVAHAYASMPKHRTENFIMGLIIQKPFLFQASNSSTAKHHSADRSQI
jgi:hypothetical protein